MRAAALALAVVAGAACGGGGGGEDAAGGREPAPAPTASAATATVPGSAPGAGGGAGGGAPGATTATTAAPSAARSTSTTTRVGATRSPAPGGSAQRSTSSTGFTAPGRYRYATTGRFSSTAGGEQPRDGETVLTVDPPAGADQRSVRQAPARTTEQVLRVEDGGAFLVSLRQSEQGITKEVRPSPPALAFPADAAPGRTWSWRAVSTDGQTTVDAAFRVVRGEEVAVGAERVATLVVEAVVTTAGDVVSTTRQTLWVSPAHRLVVRLDESVQGRLGAFSFTGTGSDRLLSLTPS